MEDRAPPPVFVLREFVGRDVLEAQHLQGAPRQLIGLVMDEKGVLRHGQNPQAAVDAPRWRVTGGRQVALEPGFAPEVVAELQRRSDTPVQA